MRGVLIRFFDVLQVVDEADRLLTQSFHDWLPTILAALRPTSSSANDQTEKPVGGDTLEKADALAPAWWDAEGKIGRIASDVDERSHPSVSLALFCIVFTHRIKLTYRSRHAVPKTVVLCYPLSRPSED